MVSGLDSLCPCVGRGPSSDVWQGVDAPQTDGVIVRGGGERVRVVRVPGHGVDGACMSWECRKKLARLAVPQVHLRVFAATEHKRLRRPAERRPNDVVPLFLPAEILQNRLLVQVPEVNLLSRNVNEEVPPTVGQAQRCQVVRFSQAELGFFHKVEDMHELLGADGNHPTSVPTESQIVHSNVVPRLEDRRLADVPHMNELVLPPRHKLAATRQPRTGSDGINVLVVSPLALPSRGVPEFHKVVIAAGQDFGVVWRPSHKGNGVGVLRQRSGCILFQVP
mmetsp:Transcript_2194/g.5082  ORF Transcript_2194/g.5082 Transcript_2194/m.5082 type:complete len:279 (+) Transcript_2194:711-1547(+)